ncbi:3D domain-containing protein [Pseudobacteroides cellulosolvens]|uniref:3D domain-containing protein n=1 Tax=Pseudobacteroides cellulosolvens ATCC 35603 = DSM 2933 TaxID=398512 RepID=A0A0L6JHW5_9FIRM|nr:3D domain-containing protein [Pseudobacteroides cellulosolvens]KNY25295.1 3D domain-containing protein [Pseudobacteroides cellulosolvens ATCC 35603 = DSM 2933]
MKFKVTSSHLIAIIVVQVFVIGILFLILISSKHKAKADSKNFTYDMVKPKYEVLMDYDNAGLPYSDIVPLTEYPFFKYLTSSYGNGQDIKEYKLPIKGMAHDEFIATAYDLSFESCGKYPSHPEYGITFSGKRAARGRTVAVDPNVIPLGSKIHMTFPGEYKYLNGWYVAEDTGRLVKGKIIDVYLGESAFFEMERFGSMKVKVKIIYPEYY